MPKRTLDEIFLKVIGNTTMTIKQPDDIISQAKKEIGELLPKEIETDGSSHYLAQRGSAYNQALKDVREALNIKEYNEHKRDKRLYGRGV